MMLEEIHYADSIHHPDHHNNNPDSLFNDQDDHIMDDKQSVVVTSSHVMAQPQAPPPHTSAPTTTAAARSMATRQPSVMSDLLEIMRNQANQSNNQPHQQVDSSSGQMAGAGSREHRPNALVLDDFSSADITSLIQQSNSPLIDQIINSSLFSSPNISPITSIGGLTAFTNSGTPTSRLQQALAQAQQQQQQHHAAVPIVPQQPAAAAANASNSRSPPNNNAVVSSTTSAGNEELNTPTVIQHKLRVPITLPSAVVAKQEAALPPVSIPSKIELPAAALEEDIDVVGGPDVSPRPIDHVYGGMKHEAGHGHGHRMDASPSSTSCTPERPYTAELDRSNMSSPYTPACESGSGRNAPSSAQRSSARRQCQSVEPNNQAAAGSKGGRNTGGGGGRKRRAVDVDVKELPPARKYRMKEDTERDMDWRQKRDRNNEAVRKSRLKNKIEQKQIMEENDRLKAELELTKRQLRAVTVQRDHLQDALNAQSARERAIVSRAINNR